jgi:probable F420-dependent oxidoreductase
MPDHQHFREVARLAEQLDFDSLWTTDHLSFENPIHEGLVALSFFAGCTDHITLGTGIYLLALRHPSVVAKQIASLQGLAGGRVVFGVGVGGESQRDFRAVGVPRAQRGARTDEGIAVLRRLWAGPDASFVGRFYGFDGVTILPRPDPLPPIWVGGRSEAALRRVATICDGWLAYMGSPESFARRRQTIRRIAEDAGRDPKVITYSVVVPISIDDDSDGAVASLRRHLSRRYGSPFDEEQVRRLGIAGDPATCVDRVAAYIDAGAEHIVFSPSSDPQRRLAELRTIAEDVVSQLPR